MTQGSLPGESVSQVRPTECCEEAAGHGSGLEALPEGGLWASLREKLKATSAIRAVDFFCPLVPQLLPRRMLAQAPG